MLLSDGRPADTKQALTYFQEQFIRGPLAGTQLHGIGFFDPNCFGLFLVNRIQLLIFFLLCISMYTSCY